MNTYISWMVPAVLILFSTLNKLESATEEDKSDPTDDENDDISEQSNQYESGSDSPATALRKQQRNSGSTSSTSARNTMKKVVQNKSRPLHITLNAAKRKAVLIKENELYKSQVSPFEWPDFDRLLEKDVDQLCEKMWITFDTDVKSEADIINYPCIATKLSPPADKSKGGTKYIGTYGFIQVKNHKSFIGDFVRCNCQYEKVSRRGNVATVPHSKFFFFIYKFNNVGYFILSNKDQISRCRIQIIDFYHL